jgi:Ser/Thr protein kinase RdoA (MazF antagonist)
MTWVPGHSVKESFDHTTARGIGVVSAKLHDHASSYVAPDIPQGIVSNRVLYFGDTSLLPNYQSNYGSMFVEAIDRVQKHLDALWLSPPHRAHLIHGDLGPNNVLRWRTRLTPIDFQDLQYGFDVQDAAITVADLRRFYGDESLIETFVAGYTSVRPWPLIDPTLEHALAAARRLGFVNLGLILRRPGLSEFIDRHSAYVAEWMGLSPRATVI